MHAADQKSTPVEYCGASYKQRVLWSNTQPALKKGTVVAEARKHGHGEETRYVTPMKTKQAEKFTLAQGQGFHGIWVVPRARHGARTGYPNLQGIRRAI